MTIDMLRHPSLSELVAQALYPFPPPPTAWPAPPASCVGSVAVRNLPADTGPERAVGLMEATVLAAPELKRRAGVRGWRALVRKPALGYTLYWEGVPRGDEERLVERTLELLGAEDLQAVVVRRVDGVTPRTVVVVNTVHPQTGLVQASGEVYYDLLCWHLALVGDEAARAALRRGRVATVLESLRRQDVALLDLPDRIRLALDGEVRHVGPVALRMLLRAGPSGWQGFGLDSRFRG